VQFQILEIIIWPKKASFKPQRIPFAEGKVNVITGASRTGKSAIIPIVDYCLGSDKCSIPVQTIRKASEWFGILVKTPFGEKLFARKEPGNLKATGDMFVLEAPNVVVPERITEKNTNVDSVKRKLDELVGLTNLDFDIDGQGSGFRRRPSFRDLGALVFQPQNIVANPDVLFYKADTYEHREKLRAIFPYVLGAISTELLAKQHELAGMQKVLARKSRELVNVKKVSEQWLAEIWSRAAEARELGLTSRNITRDMNRDELVEILVNVVETKSNEMHATGQTVREAVGELAGLQKEERDVSLQLSGLRRRYSEMLSLKNASGDYRNNLAIQKERLGVSKWFRSGSESSNCPLCKSSFGAPSEEIHSLAGALEEIEKEQSQFEQIPPAFDREFERVKTELNESAEKLQGVRIRRLGLEKTSEEAKTQQYQSNRVSRFIGAVEEALKTYNRLGADAGLSAEVDELIRAVAALEKEVSEGKIREKVRRALDAINLNAGKLLPFLDCERPNDPINLSIENLSIEVQGLDRSDYLWEIGSGSNWLAYHIAISLGLQKFFLGLKGSPVPSLLIFDQPSQVYFPKKLARKDTDIEDPDPKIEDEDVDAVRKVFEVLAKVVSETEKKLQVIVLDHAAEDIWKGIENVYLVVEWRNGKKLIPKEWLEEVA
jgi:uncharacterized protein DUF3732